MMNHLSEQNDLFDSINRVGQNAYEKGYAEGLEVGRQQAIVKGLKAGQSISIEINSELGYYFGICEAYKRNKVTTSDERVSTLANQICEMISQIDTHDSQNEKLFNELNRVRDKFKQFSSISSVKNLMSKENPVEKLTF